MWKARTGKGCTVTKKDARQKNCKGSKGQKRKLRRRGRRDCTRKEGSKSGTRIRKLPWKKDKDAERTGRERESTDHSLIKEKRKRSKQFNQ